MTRQLTKEEKAIYQKLKDDFVHFATKCLMIRTKSGEVKSFVLNKAQKYAHEKIEEQKAKTGKVRAIILKARQEGLCYTPDMRILTADYRWIPIKDAQLGQQLVAIDENLSLNEHSGGRRYPRKMRTATIEAKIEKFAEVYEVVLDNGAKIKATAQHRHLCRKRGGDDAQWRAVGETKIGDYIRYITKPPTESVTIHEDGWFGGLLDGEGSWREKQRGRLSFCQVDGAVLRRAKKYLDDKGISWYESIDNREPGESSKLGSKPVHRIEINRMTDIIQILGECKPSRFAHKKVHENHELPGKAIKGGGKCWAKVVSIEYIGKRKVIDLQTSTKTFICEGLVSHNSTYIGGRFYHQTTHRFGCQTFILAHELNATNNLFKMVQRFYEHTPQMIKHSVGRSNVKELVFDVLDSGYKLGTAGNKQVGRSNTIQLLHLSECAFYQNAPELSTGLMQAVADMPGTEIIIESTANGVGNYFHQMWQSAEAGLSDYIAIFIPWFWMDEYQCSCEDYNFTEKELQLMEGYHLTAEQIAWRRKKIVELSVNGIDGEKAFMQEYPCTSQEAFLLTGEDNFIPTDIVLSARKSEDLEHVGDLVVGVDVARYGMDRTCIIRRVGRVAYNLQTYSKKDTMEVSGLVHQIILEEKPSKVCIDVGGLGAGVVDRLNELGHRDVVVAVNFGAKPLDSRRYKNKRAEMWGEMKLWLEEYPCQIPDSDELHSDLTNVKYKVDSNSRLQLESKDDMKKRGVRSGDAADSLALTFSLPNSALSATITKRQNETLQHLAQDMQKRKKLLERSRYK